MVGMRTAMVRGLVGDLDGGRVIDLGCGDGSLSLQFADQVDEIALVDASEPMLETARARSRPARATVTFHTADLSAGPVGIPPADLVLCVGVLAHVPDPRALVREAAALVPPGGRLILQVTDAGRPAGQLLWRYDNLFRSVRGYALARTTEADVLGWTADLGLQPVDAVNHVPIPSGFRALPAGAQLSVLSFLQRSPWTEPIRVESLLLFARPQKSDE
jgi:2-polyprenyl-3-methyl-5-hydroxy-6-metoxy-1,4-benzoquinol methylase